MPPIITNDEWLKELARLSSQSSGGLTTAEWSEKLGMSEMVVRRKIRQAMERGWVTSGRKLMRAINGQMRETPTYVIAVPKGKK